METMLKVKSFCGNGLLPFIKKVTTQVELRLNYLRGDYE